MFDYGADLNAKDGEGRTALGIACCRNHPDVVKVLLFNDADPDIPGKDLPVLVSLRHSACLELLISAGADVHTYKGLVELATYHNSIDCVKLLLDAGVDPIEKHQEIYSPITTAIRDNDPEILSLLLSRGANPNEKGQDVPLKMAVNKPAILKQLLAAGADVKLYKGLIELAVYHNHLESIQILLNAGVPIDEKQMDRCSPPTTALQDNRIECLSYLLAHVADPNMKTEGVLVFRAVRFEESDNRLRMLLDAGVDLNKVWNGRTALMEACEWGVVGNVKLLLERGADVEMVDGEGMGAMDITATKGHD